MRTIAELLPEHPFFTGLDPADLALVSGCAVNRHYRPGELLFSEGAPADTFYVVRRGRVAVETRQPTGSVVLDSAQAGDVLGWSWLVPPHRWTFDARASEDTSVIVFDGACLRGRCLEDPRLGYTLLQRVVGVMSERIQSARVRLLDLYGQAS